mmetsp:Transcript_12771/g.9258  ORF Transcript_12771/g.9258 Transcript_12771/m.9258 type:complete len:173 (+) Transcript_12771:369-887(+)
MEREAVGRHDHYIGIGHTRWATHGDKTDKNAHPHYDHKERIAIIHNGLIENYQALKDELKNKYNLVPISETDTEVVAIWIGVFLDQGFNLFDSISKCIEICEGAYTFALISTLEPDSIYIIKNTGTVVIGVSKDLQAAEGEELLKVEEEEHKEDWLDMSPLRKTDSENHHIF